MALDAFAVFVNTNGVAFPDTEAVNSSGALATDGTEFVKIMIDNWMFGRQQALLNHVGLTPNGVAEADGASQELLALQRMGMHPGQGIFAFWNDTPSNLGIRVLMLTGQGILRANFTDLDDAVYVGDGDNPTASVFYHADDAGGAVRNIAGIYLILPDARGQALRGLDLVGAVDPDGASRDLGSLQDFAFQGWQAGSEEDGTGPRDVWGINTAREFANSAAALANSTRSNWTTTDQGAANAIKAMDNGVDGPIQSASETRMTNMACDIGIIY